MGKSTVTRQFAQCGAVVSDADAIVHRLMQPSGAAYMAIASHFPQVIGGDSLINRRELGRLVFADEAALGWLESVLHPLVRAAHRQLILSARYQRRRLVVLEVPLLFETDAHRLCDATLTVTCPAFLQRQRVLSRPGMTQERLNQILAKQLPDDQKQLRSDYVVHTGLGKAYSIQQVRHIARKLTHKAPPR